MTHIGAPFIARMLMTAQPCGTMNFSSSMCARETSGECHSFPSTLSILRTVYDGSHPHYTMHMTNGKRDGKCSCRCHTIVDPLRIPWGLYSSKSKGILIGDTRGIIPHSVTPALKNALASLKNACRISSSWHTDENLLLPSSSLTACPILIAT